MHTRVFVNGASGKMGTETLHAIEKENDITLVGTARRGDHLAELIRNAAPEVVVDFTHPSCVFQNTLTILEAGCHALIGTTGLTTDQQTELDAISKSKQLGVLICPNFAVGAVLMMKFAAEAAKYMPRVEIIEYHHDKKADAPSGTALKTADMIHKTNASINAHKNEEHEFIPGARGGASFRIPIHSVRLPGYVAHQEVIFGGVGQTLILRHDTISRDSFMPGVILGIRKVKHLSGLVYGLENIL
jgi:4-hydroxy-tetrahydrodipicolinate reductase